jgi:hypothetical protein
MNRRICAWAAAAVLWSIPAGAQSFRITFETDAVVISGMTPKGQAVVFGVTREVGEDDFHTVRRYLETLTDDDGDGIVRYTVEKGIPLRSIWAAADMESGDYGAAAPEGFELQQVDWKGQGLQHLPEGKDAIEDQRSLLELLVVRPKTGAWSVRVSDGDKTDADGAIDGRLEGVLEGMTALTVETPRPPASFEPDDLVLAIDPAAMEITMFKVPAL